MQRPKDLVPSRTHSKAAGDAATRGGRTTTDGSRSTPHASNSLMPDGKSVAVALTCSRSSYVASETVNSPVASTLRRVSLRPTEVNCSTGGSELETVKNECGARLSTPSGEVLPTHAIGRGSTRDVSQG